MAAAVAAEKARLRERFQTVRMALSKTERAAASRRVVGHLVALPDVGAMARAAPPAQRVVGLFAPRVDRGEVDVRGLGPALQRIHLAAAFPRVAAPGRMTWHLADEADLVEGPWGLRQPDASAPRVEPAEIGLFVVPGVAFGRDGTRLGWGGGFYDRALAQTDALAVGVTFSAALADTLPSAPHDRRMDLVVTESDGIRIDA